MPHISLKKNSVVCVNKICKPFYNTEDSYDGKNKLTSHTLPVPLPLFFGQLLKTKQFSEAEFAFQAVGQGEFT